MVVLISKACGNDDTHGAIRVIAVMTLRMVIWLLLILSMMSQDSKICANLQQQQNSEQ